MTFIVDANIIISALINAKGKEAAILLTPNSSIDYVAPEFMFEEILSKKNKIIAASHHNQFTFSNSLNLLQENIITFKVSQFSTQIINVATELRDDIDKKDMQYIALAILLEGILWTGDMKLYRGLKRKGFNHIVNTIDLAQIIKGL